MLAQVEPKYPSIELDLSEAAGNPVAVMSLMRMALRAGKVPASEVSAFFDEALSQDFAQLLETCGRWVRVKPLPVDEVEAEGFALEAHDLAA